MKTSDLLKQLLRLTPTDVESIVKAKRIWSKHGFNSERTWFETKRELQIFLSGVDLPVMSEMVGDCCVYAYIDPRNDTPFYVGVTDDLNKRASEHNQSRKIKTRCQLFHKKLNKMEREGVDVRPTLLLENVIRTKALEIYERCLISVVGRRDQFKGPLTNLTDGGEGHTGYVVSRATRQKIGLANSNKAMHDNTRKAILKANKGNKYRKGSTHTELTCQKIREGVKRRIAQRRLDILNSQPSCCD